MKDGAKPVAQQLVERLREADYERVVCVSDGRGGGLVGRAEAVGEAIERHTDRRAVVVDGDGARRGRGSVYRALSRWVDSQGDSGQAATNRLFDYLTMAMDVDSTSLETTDRAELIVETVVRLVERLAKRHPAVLVVDSPGELMRIERRALVSVMRHFAAVRLTQVDPGADSPPVVGVVWGGAPGDWPQIHTETVEVAANDVQAVREFLTDDRVVQRVAATTGGDPQRLDALFGALPDSVSQLWARRVRELSSSDRRVVEYLAVAAEPLEVSFVDRLVDVSAVTVLHRLCEGGVARRRMRDGAVEVDLAGADIREGIEQTLDESTRRRLHHSLAEEAVQSGQRTDAFVARHALEAGDERMGMQYGPAAARQLLRRGRWDRAEQLLEMLSDRGLAGSEQHRTVVELSLRIAEAKGDWQRAVRLADELCEIADGVDGRHERRLASCLMKLGRADAARRHLQQALERLDDDQWRERVRVALARAQLAYQRGDHEAARDRVVAAKETLAGWREEPKGAVTGELEVECSNILGKVALFRGELEDARRHFERNAARARRLGRSRDELRAEINLGVVAVQQRRYDEAQRRLRRALEGTEMPGTGLRKNCWLNLGIVNQRRANFGESLRFYRRALREANRCRDEVTADVATYNLATLYQDMGAYDEARTLIGQLEADDEQAGGRFAGCWAAMVEGEILLEEGRAVEAIEAFERAEGRMSDTSRLYATEMKLRRARAHLAVDEIEKAHQILEAVERQKLDDRQLEPLYRYCLAVADHRQGTPPDERRWRSIIEQLERLGSYYDAMGARLELARCLIEDDTRGVDAARLVVERGAEDLRQRAETVPERFESAFFEIPVHQQLLELLDRFRDEGLPPDLSEHRRDSTPDRRDGDGNDQISDESARADLPDRNDPAYQRWRARYPSIVGEHDSILQVFRFVDRVAPGDTTVLLCGESGTGKELVAEAIHRESPRTSGPFIKVNCAAFVEELLLSELFGHKKGAFTGAVDDRAGRFERADGGTIFLDEIGDISPKTQVALLRVLQEGTFEPVGGTETQSADVRVVAATNRDLDAMVRQGEFRLDLYYRLKGFVIEMPPLRERREDIPRLLHHFAARFGGQEASKSFSDEAVQFLSRYRWPGNVRELKNFVRSVLLFAEHEEVDMTHILQFREFFCDEDLDESLPDIDVNVDIGPADGGAAVFAEVDDTEEALVEQIVADERSLSKLKKRLEHKCIQRALRQTGGNITQAARILQMKRPRLSQIVNGDDDLLALKNELVG